MSDNANLGAAATALQGDAAATPPPAATPPATGLTGAQPRADAGGVDPAVPTLPEWVKDWDPEDRGIIEKKGWKDPKDLYKSYRELERTLGQDKLVLPKDGADPKEWDPIYNRLGRPESPDKYVPPKDADPNLFKALAPELHGAGLTQAQLDKVAAGYNKYAESQMSEAQNNWLRDQESAQAKLEREWGPNTPAEIEHNRRALRALGMSVDEAAQYMRNGSEKFLRLLNIAGHAIAEDNSGDITSDGTLGFGLTPNRAAAELQTLRSDTAFMERVRKGDAAAKQKYDRLVNITAEAGMTRRTINTGLKRG